MDDDMYADENMVDEYEEMNTITTHDEVCTFKNLYFVS